MWSYLTTTITYQNGWLKYDLRVMYKKYTFNGMWGSRKISWDGPANNNKNLGTPFCQQKIWPTWVRQKTYGIVSSMFGVECSVTRFWNIKYPKLFQKLPKILATQHFYLQVMLFKIAQKWPYIWATFVV